MRFEKQFTAGGEEGVNRWRSAEDSWGSENMVYDTIMTP